MNILETLIIEYLQNNDDAIGERIALLAKTMTDQQWASVHETAQLCCTRLEFINGR